MHHLHGGSQIACEEAFGILVNSGNAAYVRSEESGREVPACQDDHSWSRGRAMHELDAADDGAEEARVCRTDRLWSELFASHSLATKTSWVKD